MFVLASSSDVKYHGVCQVVKVEKSTTNFGQLTQTPQPIGKESAANCCKERIDLARKETSNPIIAVESFIDTIGLTWYDYTMVMVFDPLSGTTRHVSDKKILIPYGYQSHPNTTHLAQTIGSQIHSDLPHIPADDWYSLTSETGRSEVIADAVKQAIDKHYHFSDYLETSPMHVYKDFPKSGVDFADIFSKTIDSTFIEKMQTAFYDRIKMLDLSKLAIVGLESRGLMLGWGVSVGMGLPFLPARKPGKLPGNIHQESFEKEYGSDILEMQSDYLQKIERVVVIDDVIATGGSMFAACKLCERLGLTVELVLAVADIPQLRDEWRRKLDDYNVSLLAVTDPKMVKLQEWLESVGVVRPIREIQEMQQLTIERKGVTLPPEFEMLNLTDLHLPYCNLEEIPQEIFTQKNLQTLQLSGNRIEDIPPDILQLQNLKSLYLDNNLIDKLPDISELNLEVLNLDRNFIYQEDIKDIIEKIPTVYIDR